MESLRFPSPLLSNPDPRGYPISPILMHQQVSSPHNLQQAKKGQESSAISTELSLISSSIHSKSQHGDASRTYYSSSAKRSRKKTSKPNRRNSKTIYSNKERQHWGYSTTLEIYDNPWKINKALTESDLGKLNRLLFAADLVNNFMLPVLSSDAQRDAETGMGTTIRVWDVDTMSMHYLILKRWASFKNYVLIGKWNQDFVKRRELKKGDEIGLHWDSYRHCFNFSVLKRT